MFLICPVQAGVCCHVSHLIALWRVMNDVIQPNSCYGYSPALFSSCALIKSPALEYSFFKYAGIYVNYIFVLIFSMFFADQVNIYKLKFLFTTCWLYSSSYCTCTREDTHRSVRPATLITQARLCNCVGSSIVLAIGSLQLLYRKGPLSPCSTMSNKSWGGEHRCRALTATQKRGIWEEAAEGNEQYFNSAV